MANSTIQFHGDNPIHNVDKKVKISTSQFMNDPFFSIIIPTYNRADFISVAIESVLCQTVTDWELIIIDDGSTDNTKQITNRFIDKRIRYIYQNNQERSIARNKGIDIARGNYICFLDSDDYYLPNRLELLKMEILNRHEPMAMFFTGILFEKGNQRFEKEEIYTMEYRNHFDYIVKSVIGVPQSCIAREILLVNQFNKNFIIGEDMELWLRLVNKYSIIFLKKQLTVVAVDHTLRSVNEKSNNPGKKLLELLNFIFQKDHPGYNVSKRTKQEWISDTYFSIARHSILNDRRWMAIINLIISIYKCPIHPQSKHKLFLIIQLFLDKKISEYTSK